MNALENHLPRNSCHRSSNLSLAVTPAFPILVSSDIVIKESPIIQVTRNRSLSIPLAEELCPENQYKVFSAGENLFSDRLSLVSTESVVSASESEKSYQPIDQAEVCAQLSDWLIQTMEEHQWQRRIEGIDFNTEASSSHFLCRDNNNSKIDLDNLKCSTSTTLDEFQWEEGNSIFYAKSYCEMEQMPTTSTRVYDVAGAGGALDSHFSPIPSSSSASVIDVELNKSSKTRRRRLSDGDLTKSLPHKGEDLKQSLQSLDFNSDNAANNVQDLIAELADASLSKNTLKRSKAMLAFDSKRLKIPFGRRWRPPKKEFLVDLVKQNDFVTQLALQKHRCAGCGLKLSQVYAKRAQYCHYFSRLFCPCCHQGSKARIPAKILHEWNFKEYPVCDIASRFLADIEDQPVFDVSLINPELYKRARNLRRFRKLRLKIAHMWQFVQVCRLAERVVTEHGLLRTLFTSVPTRFLSLDYVDIYSMIDFERISNRNLLEMLEPLVTMGRTHIEKCMHCRQHAHLCQHCMDPSDLLFPFELDRCCRCDGCGSLTHLKCYQTKLKAVEEGEAASLACEKCERIRKKRILMQQSSQGSIVEDNPD